MAITRAQQVRQMLKEGSIEPVKQAGVMNYMPSEMVTVPKIAKSSPNTPTAKLAYITPEEQDILVDLNLYGSLDGKPNRGPGGIPSLEGDFGSPTGQAYGSDAGSYSEAGTGRDVSTDSQGRTVIGGDINQGVDVREARSAKAEAIRDQIERQKNEAIKAAQDLQAQKVIERRKRMGLKLMKEKIPGTQEYLDAEKDDTAAMLDLFINDPYREDKTERTLPTPLGIGLNLLKGPLKAGAKKTRSFFADPNYKSIFGKDKKSVLEAGRFNYKGEPLTEERFAKMSLTEKNQAYKDYMSQRLGNEIDAYGNPLNTGDEDKNPFIPLTTTSPINADANREDENALAGTGMAFRFMNRGGMPMDAPTTGGIMDRETGRQMYFLGKLVKKATRAVKKIVKSPLGKAAVLGCLAYFGGGGGNPFTAAGRGKFSLSNLFSLTKNPLISKGGEFSPMRAIGLASLSPFLFSPEQEEDDEEVIFDRGRKLDIANIRANPYTFIPRRFAAEGGSIKEPVAKKTMPLIDMDGKEKDYRETGGFVDIGRMERADDVPARLSKNEFVFTADAVRNAGDGSVDKGAEVMYNMMKNLEAGGDVSEESQGLDGARKMFQTSQRLGEVL